MKRMIALMLVSFLVLGVFANSILVLADDNVGANSPTDIRPVTAINNGSLPAGVSPERARELERIMVQQRIAKEYRDRLGNMYNTSREVQRQGNVTSVQITRTINYANGTQVNQTITIQTGNESGKVVRNLNIEREGEHFNVSIDRGINISDEFVGNQSRLRANLSNGKGVNISILPDQALQRVRDRLKLQVMNNNSNISLKERVHNNVPQVVYVVETNQNGKFLGIFKLGMKTNTEVNAENGNVVAVNRPWWAFLVSVPKESTSGNETNTTNESSAPMIPANVTNSTNSS